MCRTNVGLEVHQDVDVAQFSVLSVSESAGKDTITVIRFFNINNGKTIQLCINRCQLVLPKFVHFLHQSFHEEYPKYLYQYDQQSVLRSLS